MTLSTKFRTGRLDHMRRGSNVITQNNPQKNYKNDSINIILQKLIHCPSCLSSFSRFGARCDDARHCEQNGVVFGTNFFAQVLEVHIHALELCSLHGLGQLMIRESAPCDVRTDRQNGGHAIGHRRRELSRASSSRWSLQTSIFSLQLHRPSPPQGACTRHSTGAHKDILSQI